MAINITQQLNLVNPAGDIDSFYGPYANIGTATSTIPAALLTANSVGRKIGIITSSGKIVDYTWQLTGTNQYGFVSDYDTLDTKIDNLISSIQTSVATATTAASNAATSAANAQTAANTASTDVANLASNTKANAWMKEWAATEYTKVKADYDYVYNLYTTTEKSSTTSGWTTYNTAYNNYIGDATTPGIILTLKNATTNTSINNTTLDTYRTAYYSAYTTVLRYLGSKVTTNTSNIASHTTSIGNFQTLYNLTNPLVAVANEDNSASVPVNGLDSGSSLLLTSAGLKGALLEDTLGILNKSQVVETGLNGRKEDLLLWAGSTYELASSGAYKEYYKTNHSGVKVPLLLKKNGDGKIGPIEFNTITASNSLESNIKLNGTALIGNLTFNSDTDYPVISNLQKGETDWKLYYNSEPEAEVPARSSLLLKANGTGNFGCLNVDSNLNTFVCSSAQSSNFSSGQVINRTLIDSNDGSIVLGQIDTSDSNATYKNKIIITPEPLFESDGSLRKIALKETDTVQNAGNWSISNNIATLDFTSASPLKIEDISNIRISIPKIQINSTDYTGLGTTSSDIVSNINNHNLKITKTLLYRINYYKDTTTAITDTSEDFIIYQTENDFEYNLQFPAVTVGIIPKYRDCYITLQLIAYWTLDSILYKFEDSTDTSTLTKQSISNITAVNSGTIQLLYRVKDVTGTNNTTVIGTDGILVGSDSTHYTFIKNDGNIIFKGLPLDVSASTYPVGTLYASSDGTLKIKQS